MFSSTRGIIIHVNAYSDKYSIVHVYTELYGRMSYLVARQRKQKTRANAHFMPLSIVGMEVKHQKTREIQQIKEVSMCFPLVGIPSHPVKNAIALFLAEILYRILQTTESDPKLFEYLCNSIRYLEILEEGIANFHLVFLMNLSRYLGIFPNTESYVPGVYFDLMNGIFVDRTRDHPHYLNKEESVIFSRLLRMNYENIALYAFSRRERTMIIQHILEYYRLHAIDFPEIKSLAVMQSLFD